MRNYTDRLTFIIALPRSRTAWMAEFFLPVVNTWHDPLKTCESIDELGQKVDACLSLSGAPLLVIDTAACLFIGEIKTRFPGANFVVVRRNIVDVMHSLKRNCAFSLKEMTKYFTSFDAGVFEHLFHVPFYDFEELKSGHRLDSLWTSVTGHWGGSVATKAFADRSEWWQYMIRMNGTNIQIPFITQYQRTDIDKVRKLFKGIIHVP